MTFDCETSPVFHAQQVVWTWLCTCAQEKHLVAAVSSQDLVHGHRGVSVAGVGANHQRPPSHWVDGVEHDRVVADKVHHVVWELLCCVQVRSESSTRTLKKDRIFNQQ